MKKTIALTLAIASCAIAPAFAKNVNHTIYNTTHTCAWVTIDTSNMISPWRNEGFHYVKPGESYTFSVESRPELKYRAEPTKNADCSGGKIADVSIVDKRAIVDVPGQNGTLFMNGSSFALRFGKP